METPRWPARRRRGGLFLVSLGLFDLLRRGLRRGLAGAAAEGLLASATNDATRLNVSWPSHRCSPGKEKALACATCANEYMTEAPPKNFSLLPHVTVMGQCSRATSPHCSRPGTHERNVTERVLSANCLATKAAGIATDARPYPPEPNKHHLRSGFRRQSLSSKASTCRVLDSIPSPPNLHPPMS